MVKRIHEVYILFLVASIVFAGIAYAPVVEDRAYNVQGLATNEFAPSYIVPHEQPSELPERYIVTYADAYDDANERTGVLNTINSKDFKLLPVSVIEAPISEIQELQNQGIITSFKQDTPVYMLSNRNADQMTRVHRMPEYLYNGVPLDGRGQTVCIVDSGLKMDHPQLNLNQIVHTQCLVGGTNDDGEGYCNENSEYVEDHHSHGTSITGLFASADDKLPGLTPGAKVVALQLYHEDKNAAGYFYQTDIYAGIEYCIENAEEYNITVISMSFGSGAYDNVQSCLNTGSYYTTLFEQARAKNITLYGGAGNSGDVSCAECDGGNTYKLVQPACQPLVNSIGAMYASMIPDFVRVAGFSQRGPLLDFMAPGAALGSLDIDDTMSYFSGTSYAGPYAAAMGMLLAQKESLSTGGDAHPERVKLLLKETSENISDLQYTYDLPIFTLPIEVDEETTSTTATYTYTINPSSVFYPKATSTSCVFSHDNVVQQNIQVQQEIVTDSITITTNEPSYTLTCSNTTDTITLSTEDIPAGPSNPPIISISNINEGQTTDSNVESVIYSVSHNRTVNSCTITLNGELIDQQNSIVLDFNYEQALPEQDTQNYLQISCTDNLGLTGTKGVNFNVEENIPELPAPPVINLSLQQGWITTNTTEINITATSEVNIIWCALYENDTILINETYTATSVIDETLQQSIQEGISTFQVTCADNYTQTTSVSQEIQVDYRPPVTNLEGIENGSLYNTSIAFSLQAQQFGISPAGTTYYRLNQATIQEYTQAVTIPASGQYTLNFWSDDTAGNIENQKQMSFVLVIPDPEPSDYNFTVLAPTLPLTTKAALPFIYTVSESSTVLVSFDDEITYSQTQKTSDSTTVQPSQDGEYTVTISAQAGNKSANYSGNLLFDTTKPSITTTAQNVQVNTTKNIIFTVTDTLSGIATVTVNIDANITELANNQYRFPVYYNQVGSYTPQVTATDAAGNTRSKNIAITVFAPNQGNETNTTNQTNPTVPNVTMSLDDLSITAPENITIDILKNNSVPVSLLGARNYYTITPSAEFTRAIISFTYESNDFRGYEENTMHIYRFDESEQEWVMLSTDLAFVHEFQRDTSTNTLWAEVSSFSTYTYTAEKRACELNENDQVEQDCYDGNTFIEDGSYYCDNNYQEEACEEDDSSNGGGSSGGGGGGSSSSSSSSVTTPSPTETPEETTVELNATITNANESDSSMSNTTEINYSSIIPVQETVVAPVVATPQPEQKRSYKKFYIGSIAILLLIATISIFIFEKQHHTKPSSRVSVNVEETQAEHPEEHTQLDKK